MVSSFIAFQYVLQIYLALASFQNLYRLWMNMYIQPKWIFRILHFFFLQNSIFLIKIIKKIPAIAYCIEILFQLRQSMNKLNYLSTIKNYFSIYITRYLKIIGYIYIACLLCMLVKKDILLNELYRKQLYLCYMVQLCQKINLVNSLIKWQPFNDKVKYKLE